MKKKDQTMEFILEKFQLILDYFDQYSPVFEYFQHQMLNKELITTNQVVEKYCITRFTLYRLIKSGALKAVFKYRTYYFNANDTDTFFKLYR